ETGILSDLVKNAGAAADAGEVGGCLRQLQQLERAERAGRLAEQQTRQDLILRHLRNGRQRDARLGGRTLHLGGGLPLLGTRHGGQVEDRVDPVAALESQLAFGEVQALAGDVERSAPQLQRTIDHRLVGGAADLERTAQFDVEATAAYCHLLRRVDGE